ncbi:ComF family protein [Verticiella alkaliphila]|uniref:ComF family protein n=1 Tax=Verticiella alkaliphila TaxID=2779529 RepID=UPI00209B5CE3|nr:phosphoribosyltransferase family protein [Verticiella sp. GG226]
MHAAVPWWRQALAGVRAILPSDCPLCGGAARAGALCPGCRHDALGLGGRRAAAVARCRWCAVRLQPGQGCADCLVRVAAYDAVIVAADYAPPLNALVRRAKQSRRPGPALALGELLADAVARDADGLPPDTWLVPVPGSRARLQARGFNPAREIARSLGEYLDLPVMTGLLVPVQEDGRRQHALARADRLARDRGRFQATRGLAGQPVAIVDDVMTTGSTFEAAARALREAGADPVHALAVARTPPPGAHFPS